MLQRLENGGGKAINPEEKDTNITLRHVSCVCKMMENLFSMIAWIEKHVSAIGGKIGIDL